MELSYDTSTAYRCKHCGSDLKSKHVFKVDGVLVGVCDSSICVVRKNGFVSKGVTVEVEEKIL